MARLAPADASDRRRVRDRRLLDGVLVEEMAHERPGASVEATADLSGVSPGGALPGRDEQRAEVRVAALAGLVADDDELLLAPGLDLQPAARAASRLIAAGPKLGDAPLELLRDDRVLELLSVLEHVADVAGGRMLADDQPEQLLALFQRHGQQVPAVEVEQVEGVEDERALGRVLASGPGRRGAARLGAPRARGGRRGPGAG